VLSLVVLVGLVVAFARAQTANETTVAVTNATTESAATTTTTTTTNAITTTTATSTADVTSTTAEAASSLTTASFSETSTSSGVVGSSTARMLNCLRLPVETVQVPSSKCVVDFRLWSVVCSTKLRLPREGAAIAEAKSVGVEIVRCPANEKPKARFSIVYELTLPAALKNAASKVTTVPTGDMTFAHDVPINVTNAELTVPIWPSSGLITVDIDGDGKLVSPRSLGVVLVLQQISLNSTHVTLGKSVLKVCAAKTECELVSITETPLAFGFDEVCCLPREKQCADERDVCMSVALNRTSLFDHAPVLAPSASVMLAAVAGAAVWNRQ
jgi:hypothetical protein